MAWTTQQAKLFYDANPGLQAQWEAQARLPGAKNYGTFAYEAAQAGRVNVPVELQGTITTPAQATSQQRAQQSATEQASMNAYTDYNRGVESAAGDWRTAALGLLNPDEAGLWQRMTMPGIAAKTNVEIPFAEWNQLRNDPAMAANLVTLPNGKYGVRNLGDYLTAKYGTADLAEYTQKTYGLNPFNPVNSRAAANQYGSQQGALDAARKYQDYLKGFQPTQPGMLSPPPTGPATPAAPAVPATPSFPSAGSGSGLLGGNGSSSANQTMAQQPGWTRPTAPVQTNLRTVQDSSAWRAVPRMLT